MTDNQGNFVGQGTMTDQLNTRDQPETNAIALPAGGGLEMAQLQNIQEPLLIQMNPGQQNMELAQSEMNTGTGIIVPTGGPNMEPMNIMNMDPIHLSALSDVGQKSTYGIREKVRTKPRPRIAQNYAESTASSDWLQPRRASRKQKSRSTPLDGTWTQAAGPSTQAANPGFQNYNVGQGNPPVYNHPMDPTSLAVQFAQALQIAGVGANRCMPEPEPFELKSRVTWSKFLDKFERYCSEKYSPNKEDWIGVLGDFLSGEVKKAYRAIKGSEKNYKDLIDRLTSWIDMRRVRLETDYKQEFESANMRADESIFLYATRLEALAIKAFAGEEWRMGKALRKKFMRSVPASFVDKVWTQNCLYQTLAKRDMTWEEVRQLASVAGGEYNEDEESLPGANTNKEKNTYVAQAKAVDSKGKPRGVDKAMQTAPMEETGTVPKKREQSQGNRQYQQARNNNTRNVVCSYCGVNGHSSEDCWRRKGLCLRCGGRGHQAANCVSPATRGTGSRGRSRGRGTYNPTSGQPNNQNQSGNVTSAQGHNQTNPTGRNLN